jgi:ubiquinone/menaquinone biosynthesis C-methylase UbiE
MKIDIYKSYNAEDTRGKNLKIEYDKTSKKRPAWIWVEGLSNQATFINVIIDGKRQHYKVYMSARTPLFLPVNYTSDEMRRFYDRYSKIYDEEIEPKNLPVAKLLLNESKLSEHSNVLDLGAGTGISSILFAKAKHNVTVLDYSKDMLTKAKKRTELKNCTFVQQDVRKLKLKTKYDLIISLFSFAGSTYFDEKEMPKLWKKLANHLKPNGKIALMGFDYAPPKTLFKQLKTGKYDITGRKNYYDWYIGQKI